MNLTSNMKVAMRKEHFLANRSNKQQLIVMLRQKLAKCGCTTLQADGDADVLIVKTAVETSENKNTTLVGDDTDILVLLFYLYNLSNKDLIFRPEPKANTRSREWRMKHVKTQLGEQLCRDILFLHALLGCDTTSRVFGIGKGVVTKTYLDSKFFQDQATVFDRTGASATEVIEAGEKA